MIERQKYMGHLGTPWGAPATVGFPFPQVVISQGLEVKRLQALSLGFSPSLSASTSTLLSGTLALKKNFKKKEIQYELSNTILVK